MVERSGKGNEKVKRLYGYLKKNENKAFIFCLIGRVNKRIVDWLLTHVDRKKERKKENSNCGKDCEL